ncbi:hypothetical protein BU16DRAFT_522107 [Lophium mytilinum]|uniref:Uncharacterized protein n=1 Tax=Lophium mytilinum TaxID=390894 RepID=A0A6A6R9H1_9PEZI|nr:hypothetical protein BU16DRAFT_522107 [Lophium mytilinum]
MHPSLLSAICFLSTSLIVNAHPKPPPHDATYLNYTTIPNLFLQDSPTTHASRRWGGRRRSRCARLGSGWFCGGCRCRSGNLRVRCGGV